MIGKNRKNGAECGAQTINSKILPWERIWSKILE